MHTTSCLVVWHYLQRRELGRAVLGPQDVVITYDRFAAAILGADHQHLPAIGMLARARAFEVRYTRDPGLDNERKALDVVRSEHPAQPLHHDVLLVVIVPGRGDQDVLVGAV